MNNPNLLLKIENARPGLTILVTFISLKCFSKMLTRVFLLNLFTVTES